MAQNRVKGGRQRGEPKEKKKTTCYICSKEVSKRKSREMPYNGVKIRVCKTHHGV